MGLLDKLIDKFENRQNKRFNGFLLFYVVYDPRQSGKNVFSYSIDPELRQDTELNYHLQRAADIIRDFYTENPERVERYLKEEMDKE